MAERLGEEQSRIFLLEREKRTLEEALRIYGDRAKAAEAKLKRVRELAEGYSRATAGGRMPLYAKLCAEIPGGGWDLLIGAEHVADKILAALDAPKGETGEGEPGSDEEGGRCDVSGPRRRR